MHPRVAVEMKMQAGGGCTVPASGDVLAGTMSWPKGRAWCKSGCQARGRLMKTPLQPEPDQPSGPQDYRI